MSRAVLAFDDNPAIGDLAARLLTGWGCQVVAKQAVSRSAVVAQAGDAQELVSKALAYRPDVVITDVRTPPKREHDGLVAAVELRRR